MCLAVTNDNNPEDRIQIINRLIEDNVDINFKTIDKKRNTLHILYSNFRIKDLNFLLKVTDLLLINGIDVNAVDNYSAIPLQYLIIANKLSTKQLEPLFLKLLKWEADYKHKNTFDKSSLDYATELPWRNEFIKCVWEYKKYKERIYKSEIFNY